MDYMFFNAIAFNQDLSLWNVCNVTNYSDYDNGASSWVLPKPSFGTCDCVSPTPTANVDTTTV